MKAKTNGTEIPPKELETRLRGCYRCPMNADYTIVKDNSGTLQTRVTTRVKCDILNGQWVRPIAGSDPTLCTRRIHVMDKRMRKIDAAANGTNK